MCGCFGYVAMLRDTQLNCILMTPQKNNNCPLSPTLSVGLDKHYNTETTRSYPDDVKPN